MTEETKTPVKLMPWEEEYAQKPGGVIEQLQEGAQKALQAVKSVKMPWDLDWKEKRLPGPSRSSSGKVGGESQAPAPQPSPLDFESVFSKLVKTESRGKHLNDKGELTTSSRGAEGITQVMRRTGEDPGYGVAPLKNQSEAEYIRFGRDYLKAMLVKFDGDYKKALAAYNAGPQSVDKALSTAIKKGGDWMDHLPKPSETKPYVNSILKEPSNVKKRNDRVQYEKGETVNNENPYVQNNSIRPSEAEISRTSLLKEASKLPEYGELVSFLAERRAVPDIKTGFLKENGEFRTPGFFKTNIPYRGAITVSNDTLTRDNKGDDFSSGTLVHELTHAAERQIRHMVEELKQKNKKDLSKSEKQLLDTFEKTAEYRRGGKDKGFSTYAKQLAIAIDKEWVEKNSDYRSTDEELMAFGVGNSSRKRRSDYNKTPEHIDPSIASVFMILLNQAHIVAKEHTKSKTQGR